MTRLEAETLATNIRVAYPWITVSVLPAPLPSPDSPLVYQIGLRRGAMYLFVRSHQEWTDVLTAHLILRVA